jgi:hypothetical protein
MVLDLSTTSSAARASPALTPDELRLTARLWLPPPGHDQRARLSAADRGFARHMAVIAVGGTDVLTALPIDLVDVHESPDDGAWPAV